MWVSGGLGAVRNLMCDYLEYNADGTIKPITPTHEGVAAPGATPQVNLVNIEISEFLFMQRPAFLYLWTAEAK